MHTDTSTQMCAHVSVCVYVCVCAYKVYIIF